MPRRLFLEVQLSGAGEFDRFSLSRGDEPALVGAPEFSKIEGKWLTLLHGTGVQTRDALFPFGFRRSAGTPGTRAQAYGSVR